MIDQGRLGFLLGLLPWYLAHNHKEAKGGLPYQIFNGVDLQSSGNAAGADTEPSL
jgi:hypothetical protein